ncbi:MAG: response regulator transcription factor [Dehalococcoidia bacterium]
MKVAIIEDDPEIVEAVSLCFDLRWPDVKVASASEGGEGLNLIEREEPDIVIVDIGLPDIDGFEVCRRVRFFSDVPLIILTAKDQEFDKVKGLELGADDYITKPFSHVELLARVKAVLRRAAVSHIEADQGHLQLGRLRVDFHTREVWVEDEKVRLTPTEYSLLKLMAKNAGRVMTHQMLLEGVWGPEYIDSTDYLKVYVQRLRTKLRDNHQQPEMILSERGVGYRLVK